MTKVVLMAPLTIGEQPYAAGAEIDVDDDTAYELRSAGKAALPYTEPKEPGNYGARTGREGDPVPPLPKSAEPINGPENRKK